MNVTALGSLPLKRLHQSADIRPDLDLVSSQFQNRFRWLLADRRKVAALHVRANGVVIVDELSDDVIEVQLAKQDELEQAFVLDRLNKPLDPSIQIG